VPLLVREGKPVLSPTIVGVTSNPLPQPVPLRYVEDEYEPGVTQATTHINVESHKPSMDGSEPVINKYVSLAHFKDDLWDARYAALVRYGEENGTCNIAYTLKIDLPDGTNTNLGQWLQDQRKEKRYGNLRADRAERLQTLVDAGLLEWRPTRYDEKKWMTRFEAVLAYAAENGNVEIPSGSDFTLSDGSKIDLAKWFSTEITELRAGRLNAKREQLIHEHLVAPGYLSEEALTSRARPRKVAPDDPLWQSKYEALISYGEAHGGDYNVPRSYSFIDASGKEILLGWWLHYQRTEHRKRALRPDREEKLNALIEHGFKWDASFHSNQWERRYEALLRFYEEFKTCNVPHSYKFRDDDGTIVSLGRWLEKQRRSKKLKTLSPDRDAKLQQLVDEGKLYWEIYDAERRSRSWQDKYNLLVAYGDMNGSCELPDNAVITTVDENGHTKKVQLGHWLQIQKSQRLHNKLEHERVQLLERLVDQGKLTWEIDPHGFLDAGTHVTTMHGNYGAAGEDSEEEEHEYAGSYQHVVPHQHAQQAGGIDHEGRGSYHEQANKRTKQEADEEDDEEDEDGDAEGDVVFSKGGRAKKPRYKV
jgi:hypothetical protein